MSQRLKIPPTKSALLQLKRQVVFLEKGYTLLERKRELLTRLVYERLKQYRAIRHQVSDALAKAYRWLAITQLRMNAQMMRQAAGAVKPSLEVSILPRSNIGVEYPSVSVTTKPLQPIGLMWTDASFDQTRLYLTEAAAVLAKLGEAETALWRLLEEQRKTQKRVNALKYNIIPRYKNTLEYVEAALEEEERNTLFQIKVLKAREEAGI